MHTHCNEYGFSEIVAKLKILFSSLHWFICQTSYEGINDDEGSDHISLKTKIIFTNPKCKKSQKMLRVHNKVWFNCLRDAKQAQKRFIISPL